MKVKEITKKHIHRTDHSAKPAELKLTSSDYIEHLSNTSGQKRYGL